MKLYQKETNIHLVSVNVSFFKDKRMQIQGAENLILDKNWCWALTYLSTLTIVAAKGNQINHMKAYIHRIGQDSQSVCFNILFRVIQLEQSHSNKSSEQGAVTCAMDHEVDLISKLEKAAETKAQENWEQTKVLVHSVKTKHFPSQSHPLYSRLREGIKNWLKRRTLAKVANELRQTYTNREGPHWSHSGTLRTGRAWSWTWRSEHQFLSWTKRQLASCRIACSCP